MTLDHAIGFVFGFFFGCCALVGLLFLGPEYRRGIVAGLLANVLLGTASVALQSLGTIDLSGLPWELVAGFGVLVTLIVTLAGAAVWAFGPRGDDEPRRPSDRRRYTEIR